MCPSLKMPDANPQVRLPAPVDRNTFARDFW